MPPIVSTQQGTAAALATVVARTRITNASTSISKRAPKSDANRWRRAAHPSAPSSSRAAPAIATSSHRSGSPSGTGSITRAAIRQHEPTRDGDQEPGKQRQAGQCRQRTDRTADNRNGHEGGGERERPRKERARFAH